MSNIIEKLGITPGPYKHNLYVHGGSRMYKDSDGERQLIIYTYGPKGNALLYSQAPEMLEALIWFESPDHAIGSNAEFIHKFYKKIEPIIEKATGKTCEEVKALVDA